MPERSRHCNSECVCKMPLGKPPGKAQMYDELEPGELPN